MKRILSYTQGNRSAWKIKYFLYLCHRKIENIINSFKILNIMRKKLVAYSSAWVVKNLKK